MKCRPAGRFIASVLISVAVLVASLVIYVKLAEILSPVVQEAKRMLDTVLSFFQPPGSSKTPTVTFPVPHVKPGGATLRDLGSYALLEVDAVEPGSCRVYVNGSLVYDAPVNPGDHVRLYIASVDGKPVASRLPPRGGAFSGGVIAVDCGGVEKVWDLR